MAHALDSHEKRVRSTISTRLTLLGLGGGVAVLLGFLQLRTELQGAVRARLDQEFSRPQIRSTIQHAAHTAATEIVVKQLRPQVEEAKALTARVKTDTEKALAPLQRMQAVLSLWAGAAGQSRSAYEELNHLASSSDDPDAAGLANGAYQSINGAFAFTTWLGPLRRPLPPGSKRMPRSIRRTSLGALNDPNAAIRGMAARLRAKHEARAVPALIALIQPGGESNHFPRPGNYGARTDSSWSSTAGNPIDPQPMLEWWATDPMV